MAGKRGAPDGETRRKNREERAKKALAEQILRGKELVADHYYDYLAAMDAYALGQVKGATPTNQISSLKYLLEHTLKTMQDAQIEDEDEDKLEEDSGDKKTSPSLMAIEF